MEVFFEHLALSVALTAIIDLIRSYRLIAVMINPLEVFTPPQGLSFVRSCDLAAFAYAGIGLINQINSISTSREQSSLWLLYSATRHVLGKNEKNTFLDVSFCPNRISPNTYENWISINLHFICGYGCHDNCIYNDDIC